MTSNAMFGRDDYFWRSKNEYRNRRVGKMAITQAEAAAAETKDRMRLAIPVHDIDMYHLEPGTKLRITLESENNGMWGAKAVVVGDYPRTVVLEVLNGAVRWDRMALIKSDMMRGHTSYSGTSAGSSSEQKGALRIEVVC